MNEDVDQTRERYLEKRIDGLSQRVMALENYVWFSDEALKGQHETRDAGEPYATIAKDVNQLRADFALHLDALRTIRQAQIEDGRLLRQYGEAGREWRLLREHGDAMRHAVRDQASLPDETATTPTPAQNRSGGTK